ncbi:hypothetical protein STSV1pORF59 [Sulfolobus virus STSV1]|uniref:hypothetical protein n=1 Tax=Sulfolobus virus STSV1 TaxID=285013 RepID=UPI000042B129|nr:hypothetical protein STSV1pORF59 [Sulfolobus virus STSV1]CAH04242.1 hypothetical protein [Sulfolobus virus STSV1]
MGYVVLPTLTQYVIFIVIVSVMIAIIGFMLYRFSGSYRNDVLVILAMIYATILYLSSTQYILSTPGVNVTTSATNSTVYVTVGYADTLNAIYIVFMGISAIILLARFIKRIG